MPMTMQEAADLVAEARRTGAARSRASARTPYLLVPSRVRPGAFDVVRADTGAVVAAHESPAAAAADEGSAAGSAGVGPRTDIG